MRVWIEPGEDQTGWGPLRLLLGQLRGQDYGAAEWRGALGSVVILAAPGLDAEALRSIGAPPGERRRAL